MSAHVMTLFVLFFPTGLLAAQTPALATGAANAMFSADVARHLEVIAADSLMDRRTPSPGLEKMAQYIAEQFQKIGLRPGGDRDTWWQRYRVPGSQYLAAEQSSLSFSVSSADSGRPPVQATVSFRQAVRLVRQLAPTQADWPPVTKLVTGPHTATSLQQANLLGQSVLYIPAARSDSAARSRVIAQLAAVSRLLVILNDDDSASFAQQREVAHRQPLLERSTQDVRRTQLLTVAVQPQAIQAVLSAAGVDLAKGRAATAPSVSEISPIRVRPNKIRRRTESDSLIAPNVIGVLEGRDPTLKADYVVVTAHMDRLGREKEDNAAGIAALLALAQAFRRPEARPRRSLVFVAVSGGTTGQWGSRFFNLNWLGVNWRPIAKQRFVASLNLDLRGLRTADSIVVAGLHEIELPVRMDWIANSHPELGVTVTDGGTVFEPTSDHFPFVQRLATSLSFQGKGLPGGRLSATPDAAQVARLAGLMFYVGQEIGNADRPPRWTPVGRQQMLQRGIQE